MAHFNQGHHAPRVGIHLKIWNPQSGGPLWLGWVRQIWQHDLVKWEETAAKNFWENKVHTNHLQKIFLDSHIMKQHDESQL